MTYRLSGPAEADVLRLYLDGVLNFGVSQTEDYYAGLTRYFEFLGGYPEATRGRPEFQGGVRACRFQSHVVIYRAEAYGVLIVRVRHGRENWKDSPF